jgi:Putative rhamnosyl transferase
VPELAPRRRRQERFVFGVPLIARAAADDWAAVEGLLELTLRSVLSQTDPDFELLLAGHDLPASWTALVSADPRFRFLPADWRPERPTGRNDDGGRKKWMIHEHVRKGGGGLLMFLDADDLLDRRTVCTARRMIGRTDLGGVVAGGIVLDLASLRFVRLPDRRVYDGMFLELCGSSTVGRIEPQSPDPARRDPHAALGSHHRWPEAAAAIGAGLARLPVSGAYLVNTGQNHSETHGPHAKWRRDLSAAVRRAGDPIDRATAARLGIDLDLLSAMSLVAAPRR